MKIPLLSIVLKCKLFTMDFPVESLRKWFLENRRTLPWRGDPSPYEVWVSEVMLQQTQVVVVMPYFEQWMRLFPTISDLANSSPERVLKAWEGLGYYARAKNLHLGAKQIIESFGGELPDNPDALAKIKGLGPYTIAAILAFAFKKKIAPIDSNVSRLLCRFFCIDKPIENSETKRELDERAQSFLPQYEPWIISEALIEFGALICTKKPACNLCPIKKGCLAYRHQIQETLPRKKERPKTIFLFKHVGVIHFQGKVALQKGGESGKVLSDLYEFPSLEGPDAHLSMEEAKRLFAEKYSLSLREQNVLPKEKQSYTRYQLSLYPYLFECEEMPGIPDKAGFLWVKWEELHKFPFSSGHRRIFKYLRALL